MEDNVTFREAPVPTIEQPKVDIPEPVKDNTTTETGESDREPVELRDTNGRSVVLDALGISENTNSLPAEDKANLNEVKDYVLSIVKAKGLSPTVSAFTKTLNSLKGEMGLNEESEPSIVLDRIAGVVKAWRNLSFIKDPAEKKKIFYKLARLNSSIEMNKEVFKLMEDHQIWQ